MYDGIVLPTDGSDGTEHAVEQAIEHANTYDAALHVLHVIDARAFSPEAGTGIDAGYGLNIDSGITLDALEESSQQLVSDVSERATQAGVETVIDSVRHGIPHRELLEYVDEHDLDLVVMGTHGRSGFDRYLLGSVTEKVVRLSDVPVLTVRMPEESAGSP